MLSLITRLTRLKLEGRKCVNTLLLGIGRACAPPPPAHMTLALPFHARVAQAKADSSAAVEKTSASKGVSRAVKV